MSTTDQPQSSCVTTETVHGFRIVQTLGTVFGTSVRSRNDIGNWMGNLRANFGGSQGGYAHLVSATRQEAISMMLQQADGIGANAVIGMRFDSGQFDSGKGQSMEQCVAYGTAVVLEPEH
ncbi:YbjQ family protein [Acidithiobacillus caldus]|uniref:YbjQ family protein n=1 Tax=Acidithiobacillus caldus TaxID=33059 RepID=UPI001C06C16F|nr:YbjQ family protein [Acidithiobacillus caldus]MBU2770124.1 YbjQ family protein [Acidithiobacillus caldus]